MAQKTLNAFVVIGGRVDNTFGQIGTALINVGSTIDEVSQKLINFGKESVEVYRNYQDSMLDAEVALSTTYGRGSRELASVMKTLDAQATEWAASTIFHTDDVANAIAQAAHANWDLSMILDGIPAAMKLAQAGSMDLSEAVDFIIKSANGAGLEFKDLNEWIDEWTFAANSSAGDVEEFGEAMLKMGNTMKFAGSKEELLAMLAILHDSGTTGAAAGTLLRNSMIRLIAPTKKASDAMAQLGLTQDDVDEAMSEVDGNTEEAVARLEELGFSVYDTNGNLKDFMTIFSDLNKATEGMTDEEKYAIWSAIFPTKTITGGMALMEAAADSIDGLYAALVGGDAAGYGNYAAETMMSGLTGSIETFNSKLERLKQITGAELEGDVTYWTDKLGEFVDNIAEMDSASFSGLVGGLEVIAGAGPGLVLAGSAFRLIGFALGTPVGRIAMGALAVAALTKAISDFSEAKFAEKFGDLELDMEPIRQHLQEVTTPFKEARADIDAYVDSMDAAVLAYTDKSSELASGLITKMVTGSQLTEEEKQSFMTMGDDIGQAIIDGIGSSYDAVTESFTLVSGGIDEAVTDPMWISFMGLLEVGYSEAISKAQSLSGDLRQALFSGFEDGHLTGEEVENIQSILDDMNELLSLQTAGKSYAERQRLMHKAQTLGIEGLNEITSEVNASRDEIINGIYFDQAYAHGMAEAYLRAHKGEYFEDDYIDDDFIDTFLTDIDAKYEKKATEQRALFADSLISTYDYIIGTSDLSEVDQLLTDVARAGITGVGEDEAQRALGDYKRQNEFFTLFEKPGSTQAWEFYQKEVEALGGYDAVLDIAELKLAQGDLESAQQYALLLKKAGTYTDEASEIYKSTVGQDAAVEGTHEGHTPYTIDLDGTMYGADGMPVGSIQQMGTPNTIDLGGTMYGANGMPVSLEGVAAARTELESGLAGSPIDVPVGVDGVSAARAEIESGLAGSPVVVPVSVGIGGGGTRKLEKFADGGRATEPSIYGEAGPEWFIPERHDQNTARLIAAAAYASGFSLAELAAMNGARMFANGGVFGSSSIADSAALDWASLDYGGREASGNSTTFDVHYAPVINAQNAEGVGRELAEDKKRLKKLLRELREEEELYESVVRY